ncbi:MAG: glutamine synthetase family protein [Pseudomonadota bacterium]
MSDLKPAEIASFAAALDYDEYQTFTAKNPDLEAVEFLLVDPNGILRGKWAPASALEKAFTTGINFPQSLHGLDVWGREVPATGLHIESGDVDGFFRAVPGTLKIVPWASRKTAQVLLRGYSAEGDLLRFDCRNALARITKAMAKRGQYPVAAFELEFYLLKTANDQHLATPAPVGSSIGPDRQRMYGLDQLDEFSAFFEEMRHAAHIQDIPIDTIISEAAPGQFEVNLNHRCDPLRAADDAIMLRRIVIALARKHGLQATFMAKPFMEHAGNGMHVHTSIVDEAGNNIFAAKEDGRDVLESAVAELIATMAPGLLLFINSWNGFRRIRPGSYAPTRAIWGENNRSVAVRIPASPPKARRIEHRIAGADANPYLVMCAVLQAIYDGIEKGQKPPAPVTGNAYETEPGEEQLPTNMRAAITLMLDDDFGARALGPELNKIYTDIKRAEVETFEQEITPLERTTYL